MSNDTLKCWGRVLSCTACCATYEISCNILAGANHQNFPSVTCIIIVSIKFVIRTYCIAVSGTLYWRQCACVHVCCYTSWMFYLVPTWVVWVVELLNSSSSQHVFLLADFSHAPLVVHDELLVISLMLLQTLFKMLCEYTHQGFIQDFWLGGEEIPTVHVWACMR